MSIRAYLLTSSALASAGALFIAAAGIDAQAQPAPAVSDTNFRIDGFGGYANGNTGVRHYGDGLGGATADLTMPIGDQFGLQVDGMAGDWGGSAFYSVGGHLFWRDPDRGSFGAYGSWTRMDRGGWPFLPRSSGVSSANAGGEGELYWDAITLRGLVGWEGAGIPGHVYTMEDISWYADPNLKFSAGHRYLGANHAAALGAEWLTGGDVLGGGLSVFAEGRIGSRAFSGVWGGLRLYFGQSETLIDKQRRDDPVDALPDNLFAIQSFVGKLDKANKDKECGGSSCSTSGTPSDVRLKRDIVLLKRLMNGIGVYRYRYHWSNTLYVGVMAQEVAKIVPSAVARGDDGHLSVDYARLGMRLLTWSEWLRIAPEHRAA
jgi:hypothetical protein